MIEYVRLLNKNPDQVTGISCRLGSARAVNRRYISDCVPLKQRIQASAGFVSASALGMACGPALAGLLQADFNIYFISINSNTLPGWAMALAWLVYLPCLWIFFKEPDRGDTEDNYFPEGDAGDFTFKYLCIIIRTCLIIIGSVSSEHH